LLLELAAEVQPGKRATGFSFRARRPVFDGTDLTTHAVPGEGGALRLWATDADGALAMDAILHLEDDGDPG
jgi:3-methylfumaryl-CoA hydratase